MSARETLRCRHCRDLIGIYEPLVVVRDGLRVRTSRAAAAGEALEASPCFHAECFEAHDASEEPRDT
jgi:hypothetical protein